MKQPTSTTRTRRNKCQHAAKMLHSREMKCGGCGQWFDLFAPNVKVGLPILPNTLTGLPDHNRPYAICPKCDFRN